MWLHTFCITKCKHLRELNLLLSVKYIPLIVPSRKQDTLSYTIVKFII